VPPRALGRAGARQSGTSVRSLRRARPQRRALSCLAARCGGLHCPDDAQAERREVATLLLSYGIGLLVRHVSDHAHEVGAIAFASPGVDGSLIASVTLRSRGLVRRACDFPVCDLSSPIPRPGRGSVSGHWFAPGGVLIGGWSLGVLGAAAFGLPGDLGRSGGYVIFVGDQVPSGAAALAGAPDVIVVLQVA
jgi:hypothetical protein